MNEQRILQIKKHILIDMYNSGARFRNADAMKTVLDFFARIACGDYKAAKEYQQYRKENPNALYFEKENNT